MARNVSIEIRIIDMRLSYLIQLDKCLWNSKYSLKAYAEPNYFGAESYDKSEVNNPENGDILIG